MSTYSIAHSAFDPKDLWVLPMDSILSGVRVNGEDCKAYTQPLPYQVKFDPPLTGACKIEFIMYRKEAVYATDDVAKWPSMAAVEPSDAEDINPKVPAGLFVTKGGTIAGITEDGVRVAVTAADGASVYSPRFRRIHKRGTTANGIVALYPPDPRGAWITEGRVDYPTLG